MGLGHLGVPWGWVSWGVRRWGCHLGLDGVLVTLDAVSLAAACGAAGDACAGGRRLPAWRPYCSGVGPGGGFGDLGALCLRVGVTAGPGGLGSWLVCRREHGLVHALGPGSGVGVFDASVPPQGGSNRGGVNGPYLGVLLSYVVWELTGWWGGVVFPLLWGLVGRAGLPWALVRMGLGPPPWADLGNGGAYGGQRGSWLQRGGYFAPSDAFLPSLRLHFSRSITPTHR